MLSVKAYSNAKKPIKMVQSPDFGPRKEKKDAVKGQPRLANSLSRSRTLFSDYALCNPFTYFFTGTISPERCDRTSLAECKAVLLKTFNNYKTRYSVEFKYLLVPEQHANGSWHFHGFLYQVFGISSPRFIKKRTPTGLIEVPNTIGVIDWPWYSERVGYCQLSIIEGSREDAVSYCLSYMGKSFANLDFTYARLVLASRGLKKPDILESIPDAVLPCPADFSNAYCRMAWLSRQEASQYFINLGKEEN